MAVRLRLKKLGRKHRPYYRICAMDGRSPRDGRVLEELGTYDPLVPETDARAILKRERIDYWLSVGAQPTDKVQVLIKKYGTDGTHIEAQKLALDRLAQPTAIPDPGVPASLPKKKIEKPKKKDAGHEEIPAAEGDGGTPVVPEQAEGKPSEETKAAEPSEEATQDQPTE
ncbi:MAG: 30S ribosomal protein S16 [Pirellulales bacterium]|nr:30S ribosomal protein S16 [Pirellulales bacterium]